MNEIHQDGSITPVTQQPAKRAVKKPSEQQGQSFRVGNKIVRIDAASIDTVSQPHTPAFQPQPVLEETIPAGVVERRTTIPVAWSELTGVVDTHELREMGLGDVAENNTALQEALREMNTLEAAKSVQKPETAGALKLKPAWEVDYFRWPRLARRLLKTNQGLFDQIGGQLLGDLQPTRSRIGVCSTFSREGKTTIATCLARWSALSGKRTLLIDADVEHPKMTTMCGLDCTFGWQSVLGDDFPVSEVMIRSIESGLVFMPSRSDSIPMITDKAIDRLSMITFQMKYEFDVVVIDMGTIDNVCAHGTETMDVVDAMLVTRDPSRTSVGQMMDTRRVLNNLGIQKTYVAQNFARKEVA